MFVIRRQEDSKFVAQPGSKHSYTQYLQKAQRFGSREIAEGNACGNEFVVSVEDCF